MLFMNEDVTASQASNCYLASLMPRAWIHPHTGQNLNWQSGATRVQAAPKCRATGETDPLRAVRTAPLKREEASVEVDRVRIHHAGRLRGCAEEPGHDHYRRP